MNFVSVFFLTVLFLMVNHYQKVEAWSCTSPIRKEFSTTGTGAVLKFSADLSNLNSPRQFFVYFYDNTIQCSIRYNADRTYTTDVVNGVSITGDTAGNVAVTLQNVQQISAGVYVMNSPGLPSRCNCLYILGVPDQPTITLKTAPFEGTNVVLECNSKSSTKPGNHSLSLLYNWVVNRENNPSDTRYSYSPKGRNLTLSSVVKEDKDKKFTCTATENVTDGFTSSQSDIYSFHVYFGPETTRVSVQSPYVITEGNSNITIKCSSDCFPNCTYEWSKLTRRFTETSTGIFFLPTITRFIAGNYSCTSRNSADESRQSLTAISIIVQYAPAVIIRPSDNSTKEGINLTLYCEGIGIPSKYNYRSFKQIWNNSEILNHNKELEGTPQFSSIHFEPLTFQDTGTYYCQMNNGIKDTSGVLNQIGSREILVEARPKILTDKLRFAGSKDGAVMIHIPFYSHPKIKAMEFTKFDKSIVSNNLSTVVEEAVKSSFYGKTVLLNGSSFNFEINNLKETDFGNYTFKLTNTLGVTEIITHVVAEGRPSPPTVFQYLYGHSAPTFVWKKSFNGGLVQRFIIQVSAVGSEIWTNHTHVDEEDISYQINSSFYMATIRGMHPGVYTARILSYNTKGESDVVYLSGNFEVSEAGDTSKVSTVAIAAGSASGVIVIVAVVVVICFLRRRNKYKDRSHSRLKTGKSKQEEQNPKDKEDNPVNHVCVSADVTTDSTYSQPMKKKKKSEVFDEYAVVVKQNKKGKETIGNAYEENPYENPVPEVAKDSQKFINKDGLIYADLALNEIPKGKRNQVKTRVDSMTEYVEVDFTKKADPLPESDEDETQTKT